LLGLLLQNPTGDADLLYVAKQLENIANWLKNKSIKGRQPQPGMPFPNQVFNSQGGLRENIGDPMNTFIAGLGRS
jgi:hypothetical protein